MAHNIIPVRITVTLEVNVADWCDDYGVTPGQVGKDVQSYVETLLHDASPHFSIRPF